VTKLTLRGRNRTLPIIGDKLTELTIASSGTPTLVFRDGAGGEAELRIADAITLHRGDVEVAIRGSDNKTLRDPRDLHPLLELVGAAVVEAWTGRTGTLEIRFANEWTLRVTPVGPYTAWDFVCPRPGRQRGGNPNQPYVHLHAVEGGFD
jgi:hypothetical protein